MCHIFINLCYFSNTLSRGVFINKKALRKHEDQKVLKLYNMSMAPSHQPTARPTKEKKKHGHPHQPIYDLTVSNSFML